MNISSVVNVSSCGQLPLIILRYSIVIQINERRGDIVVLKK